MPSEDPLVTARQEFWTETAETVSNYVAKQVKEMPSMDVDDLGTFLEVLRNAMWFEVWASTYDAQVRQEQQEGSE